MPDDTPTPPKRTRKRSTRKAAPAELVGVMATDPEPDPALVAVKEAGEAAATTESAEAAGGETTGAETPEPEAQPAATVAADQPEAGAGLPDTVLRIERGGIGEATAGSVEVHVGGIGALEAEDVFVQWGGVGAARADRLAVEFGSVGAALAGEMRLTQGFASAVAAREATIEQALVRTLIAQEVTINRPTGVLVMIAQRVSGDVRPVLDWRGALAAGAAFALITALIRGAREARDRR